MKLTYIYHSCFVIESEQITLIFDYYKDTEQNYVQQHINEFPGKLYVFSSHSHRDHFNPEILNWREKRPDIQYILSKDIAEKHVNYGNNVCFLDKFETYCDNLLSVKAFGSTDIGVSFLVEIGEKRIFHAGDLNNWHWKEESTEDEAQKAEAFYLSELGSIPNEVHYLDVLMYPIDPRLGKEYTRGAEQFLEKIKVDLFVPMHFWNHHKDANAFAPKAILKGCRFFEIQKEGDLIEIK